MSDSLYSRLSKIRQDVFEIKQKLGDPRAIRAIAIEDKTTPAGYFFLPFSYKITTIPSSQVGLPIDSKANIFIELNDLIVSGVPRHLDRNLFKNRIWIDAEENPDSTGKKIIKGTSGRVLRVDDSKGLSYTLIIRLEYEQKRF